MTTHRPDYWTIPQVAVYLNVSRGTVHKWIACGIIVAVQLTPRVMRIADEELRRFERAQIRPVA